MTLVANGISAVFRAYEFLILVRVILSWLGPNPYRLPRAIVRFLYRVTEPILAPLRRVIPPIGGTVDISPVAAMILLDLARMLVVSLLYRS
ncbi:MAG TPA: YggT family protein [Anaerolineae bacterium]|nr:YggT family protein [Anaerolineae bacterium]